MAHLYIAGGAASMLAIAAAHYLSDRIVDKAIDHMVNISGNKLEHNLTEEHINHQTNECDGFPRPIEKGKYFIAICTSEIEGALCSPPLIPIDVKQTGESMKNVLKRLLKKVDSTVTSYCKERRITSDDNFACSLWNNNAMFIRYREKSHIRVFSVHINHQYVPRKRSDFYYCKVIRMSGSTSNRYVIYDGVDEVFYNVTELVKTNSDIEPAILFDYYAERRKLTSEQAPLYPINDEIVVLKNFTLITFVPSYMISESILRHRDIQDGSTEASG